MRPKVSVITATRDRPRMLLEAYRSLQAQTFKDFEWIVAVNGRRATSLEAAVAITGRLRVRMRNWPKETLWSALNRAVGVAQGDYIHFLSDDDLLEPDFLEECVSRLDAYPLVSMVGTDHVAFLDGSNELLPMPCMLAPESAGTFNLNSTMFRKSSLPRFDESFRLLSDEDLFFRLRNAPRSHICLPLMRYRIHPGQISENYLLRRYFEHQRVMQTMGTAGGARATLLRLLWLFNTATGFLGTRVKRRLGLRVVHGGPKVDRLRWSEL